MQKKEYKKKPWILELVEERGFKVFCDGDYDLNIIALRRLNDRQHNKFDDELHIVYKKGVLWIDEWCACTTDPGTYWLKKTDYRADGVAILVHDQQARGAYKIGLHRGYVAYEQVNNVKIWRDNNLDAVADYNSSKVHSGVFKCNIHRSSLRDGGSEFVNKYSAGCIVVQDSVNFSRCIDLAHKQVVQLGYKTFSLTILGVDYGRIHS